MIFGRTSQRDQRRAEAYRHWLQKRNPFAIASLVLGIVSLIEFGVLLVFGVAGILTGIVALIQLRRRRSETEQEPEALPAETLAAPDLPEYTGVPVRGAGTRGHGLAVAGIVLSALSLVVAVLLYRLPPAGG